MANAIPVASKADPVVGPVKTDAEKPAADPVVSKKVDAAFTVPEGAVLLESHQAYRQDH